MEKKLYQENTVENILNVFPKVEREIIDEVLKTYHESPQLLTPELKEIVDKLYNY